MTKLEQTSVNELFPVFLKLNQFNVLLIGGGIVGLEKLSALIKNSPKANVTIVSLSFTEELKSYISTLSNVELVQDEFNPSYLEGKNIVISALNNIDKSAEIKEIVNAKGLLYNAADKPELCDFYLGSTVTKGNLKIGISTNGKSPTMAKRIKETLNDVFPDETQEVLENLYQIRSELKGDFEKKIKTLNKITKDMVAQEESTFYKIKKAALYSVLIIIGVLISHVLLSYIPFDSVKELGNDVVANLDENIGWYLLIGFVAQMIDGALGMAYGVSVTTFLLSLGIPIITPAIASASMHASEIFTSGSSSLVYMRHKNINKKMFRALLIPGVIGAIVGVTTVSFVSKEYFSIIRPLVAVYTLVLGVLIIIRTFNVPKKRKKIKQLFPVAFTGGFLDSVGGGGWGPIVTTSLLAGGRHLRYAVGSSHLAKFFVAFTSTITFFFFIGLNHWQIIFGLVIGGMIASPMSIYFSTKIPIKKGLLLVGTVIILISLKTIIQTILK
ncbi:TSUP family transporter [Crocinitomicaceae bacterium]|nr:TSUP family transporter [Crocinitomicaceae bacterium]